MVNPIITAALTGPVATKADNPGLPGSVAEIAAAPRRATRPGRPSSTSICVTTRAG